MTRRIERVNNLIRQEISELLQRQVKDPRLGDFVAVTEVSTTADLRHARIFVSCKQFNERERSFYWPMPRLRLASHQKLN